MRYFFVSFCSLLLSGLTCAAAVFNYAPTYAWIRVDGMSVGINLTPGETSPGGQWTYASWGPEDKRSKLVTWGFPAKPDQWSELMFSFTADHDGKVTLNLMGPHQRTEKGLRRVEVIYDEITVVGSSLTNGDFAKADGDGRPVGWYFYANDGQDASMAKYLNRRGSSDSACVMVWHNGSASQTLTVKKGVPVTVRGRCRFAVAADQETARNGNRPQLSEADLKYESSPDCPVDFSSSANMGFRDPKSGDAQGGWSDQGPENDMGDFDVTRVDFGGVKFRIIDPAKNGGRAVMTFRGPYAALPLTRAEIKLPQPQEARYLYLFHTTCWNQGKERIGRLAVTLTDGRKLTFDVNSGRDVADWWNAGKLPNGSVVYSKANKSALVGLYLSKFKLGEQPVKVASLTLETDEKAIWIVVGTTLSCRNVPLPGAANFVAKANERWKAIDLTDLQVAAGSALDLSGLVEAGPAGRHGRTIIAPNGGFAFEKQPGCEVRFYAFNAMTNHLFTDRDIALNGATDAETKENIRSFAAQVRRQGYNMIRLQLVDLYLMGGAAADYQFNPVALDRFDYLVHSLKQEGVYLGIDMFSYTGYLKLISWKHSMEQRYKDRSLVEKATREMWVRGVRLLMNHRNPYTQMTLNEEPALVYATLHNEQDLGLWGGGQPFPSPEVKAAAEKLWREFLVRRYHNDFAALAENWKRGGIKLAPGTTFASIPFDGKAHVYEAGPRGADINAFFYELESDMMDYYHRMAREIGYQGYSTLYDAIASFRMMVLRNANPVISMHGYHNHPSGFSQSGSRMAQDGAIGRAASYWRYMMSTRYLNRPMLITEYGFPYWGCLRHEEGLLLPAYSSLQRLSAITVHSQAVATRSQPLEDFYLGRDPIGRAGQVLGAFLFLRRDVAPSPHTVALALNDSYALKPGNMNRSVSSAQSKIALLCGFGLEYLGKPLPGLPPYPKADLTLLPADGSKITASDWAAGFVDQKDGRDLDRVIAIMKKRGILAADNPSSDASGIFQSDTGELNQLTKDSRLTVITPRTEGVALCAGQTAKLKCLTVNNSTVAATIAVTALDGKTLAECGRLLLIYSTDAVNTGMETSDDRVVFYKRGKLPVLLETGNLEITLRNANADKLELWALGIDGRRKERVPFVVMTDGQMVIKLNTAQLKSGPTPFFELVRPD